MVSPELGVDSLERRVLGGLGLLDTVRATLSVSSGPCWIPFGLGGRRRTRSGAPCATGCAETSSLTL